MPVTVAYKALVDVFVSATHLHNGLKPPNPDKEVGSGTKNMHKTVVELDLKGYSDIARELEEHVSAEIVLQFNDQIQGFVDSGLSVAGMRRAESVMATTGDGAILVFDSPEIAHRFAAAVHEACRLHNYERTVTSAKRWFRIGVATGPLAIETNRGAKEMAGSVIARAVRLEAGGNIGEILVDTKTYAGLSDHQKAQYGPEESIGGKRDEMFPARRCVVLPGVVAGPPPPAKPPSLVALPGRALKIWQDKLDFLEEQLAIVSSAAQKFEIKCQIAEATEKIAQFEALTPSKADDRNTPQSPLDMPTQEQVARAYFDLLGPAIQRIKVGGGGKVKALDLKKLYVSLIADPTSFDERQKARELEEELAKDAGFQDRQWSDVLRPAQSGVVERVLRDEIPGDLRTALTARTEPRKEDSADANAEGGSGAEGETLHNVVRRERSCVLLGDPGSGKSVLCCWLARELSECWRARERSRELGPARVPFLIVLRDLAQRCGDGEVESIVDYLVRCSRPTNLICPEGTWKQFIEQTLKHGKAFMILDGLDEVPRKQLLQIRQMIEVFTLERVASTVDRSTRPDSGVGNQIVITSRITGYYQTALPSDPFAHFLIRPMTDGQIEEFCRHWCEASGRPGLTGALLSEIFDPKRPNIRSMASNPLLLSILCQLGTRDSQKKVQLPQIRAELYEKVVQETVEEWRKKAHTSLREEEPYFTQLLSGVDNVLALFAPVAGYMHASLISNEIGSAELQDWLVKALAWFEGKMDYELDGKEWDQRKNFLMDALERVVGVLSERSLGRYSFLHLTFQEYLAGISLLLPEVGDHTLGASAFDAPAEALVKRIIDAGYLSDLRWRQPLLLLCGQLAWMETSTERGRQRPAPCLPDVIELLDVCHEGGKSGLLGEQWALFLAEVLAEVPDTMLLAAGRINAMLVRTVTQLLDAYGRFGPSDDRQRGRLLFAERLAVIRRRVGIDAFESVLFDICKAETNSPRLAVAAHLLLWRAWLSQRVVDFFGERREHDTAQWHWAIHRLLRQAATGEPLINIPEPPNLFKTPPAGATRELRRYREALPEWQRLSLEWEERVRPAEPLVPSKARSLHRALRDPINQVAIDAENALLTAAILGAFGDYNTKRRVEKYQEYVGWLQQSDTFREASLDVEPWRYVPWFGAEDTVYNMAVHLDVASKKLYLISKPSRLDAAHIVRTDRLARETATTLSKGNRISEMLAAYVREPREGCDFSELLAVCRLGGLEDVLRSLRPASRRETERVTWHLERIQDEVSDACYRGAKKLQEWLSKECNTLSDPEWHFINRTLCFAWVASGFIGCEAKQSPTATLPPCAYSDLAETWGKSFLGMEEDKAYVFAVSLDSGWKAKTVQEHQALLRAIVRSASLSSLRLSLPDLLDLGTGMLSLPSPVFYDAVIELAGCTAERIRSDLSEGWVSVVLKALQPLDPLAAACACFYATTEAKIERGNDADLPGALARWRALLCVFFIPTTEASGVLGPESSGLVFEWLQAWGACPQEDYRLVLARDAASLGIISKPEIGKHVCDLLPVLNPAWCAEGALLAGCLARQLGEDGGKMWLGLALDCLERTVDEDWKAEILSVLSPLVSGFGDDTDRRRTQDLRSALPLRLAAVAENCPSRWVRDWAIENWPKDEEIRGALTATLLVAAAIDERLRDAGGLQTALAAVPLWRELTKAFGRKASESKVRGIIDRLIDLSGTRSLLLSESAMNALQAGRARRDLADRAGMTRVLPLLDRPAASVLPRIRHWRTQLLMGEVQPLEGFAGSLHEHAVLWLTEVERRFADEDLAPLYRLATSGDDRSRARAQIALHGKEIWLGAKPARFSLTEQGSRGADVTMRKLAERVHQERNMERHVDLAKDCLGDWNLDDTQRYWQVG